MNTAEQPHLPLSVRYGFSTQETFFNLIARRHLMPSVMDDVPPDELRCLCPSAGPLASWCILPADLHEDHLCAACREHCFGEDRAGVRHRLVDVHGPARALPAPTVVWAASPNLKRIHAYERTPTVPFALCRQSQGTSWDDVQRLAGQPRPNTPVCKSCVRLNELREAGRNG